MCSDMAAESGTSAVAEQSEESRIPVAAARPTGISGVSPKHLAVGAQPLPCSSSSEDIDNSSDDQVDTDTGVNCRGKMGPATRSLQGFHTTCKVLDSFLEFLGPRKSWQMGLVLESPEN